MSADPRESDVVLYVLSLHRPARGGCACSWRSRHDRITHPEHQLREMRLAGVFGDGHPSRQLRRALLLKKK